MTQQTAFHPLGGGMDLVTPAVALLPGRVVASLNYEPVAAGYRRLRGFERFDGSTRPGDRDYYVVPFANGEYEPPSLPYRIYKPYAGSGSMLDLVVTGGSWAEANATGYLVYIRDQSLLIEAGEQIDGDAGVRIADAIADSELNGTSYGGDQRAAWQRLATEAWRPLISPVPGFGPVRGIWSYGGDVFATRDNDYYEGTAGYFFKAGAGSWQYFNIGQRLYFENGGPTGLIEDGDALTVQVSGFFYMPVTVVKIRVLSGSWAAGTGGRRHLLQWLYTELRDGGLDPQGRGGCRYHRLDRASDPRSGRPVRVPHP